MFPHLGVRRALQQLLSTTFVILNLSLRKVVPTRRTNHDTYSHTQETEVCKPETTTKSYTRLQRGTKRDVAKSRPPDDLGGLIDNDDDYNPEREGAVDDDDEEVDEQDEVCSPSSSARYCLLLLGVFVSLLHIANASPIANSS